jgi:hypothetical protein
MQDGQLPDDANYIAGQLGCSVRKWNALRSALIGRGKISADLGIISNFRADNELNATRSYQDKQRENARQPRKTNDLPKPSQQPEGEPKPSHTSSYTKRDSFNGISEKAKSAPSITEHPAYERGLSFGEQHARIEVFDALKAGQPVPRSVLYPADAARNLIRLGLITADEWAAAQETAA